MYQCGFCKGYSTQHCLLAITDVWKTLYIIGLFWSTLLIDLSQVFHFSAWSHHCQITSMPFWHKHSKTNSQILNKGLRFMMHIPLGKTSFMMSNKDPYSVLSYLIYIYSTFCKTVDDTTIPTVNKKHEWLISSLETI